MKEKKKKTWDLRVLLSQLHRKTPRYHERGGRFIDGEGLRKGEKKGDQGGLGTGPAQWNKI